MPGIAGRYVQVVFTRIKVEVQLLALSNK